MDKIIKTLRDRLKQIETSYHIKGLPVTIEEEERDIAMIEDSLMKRKEALEKAKAEFNEERAHLLKAIELLEKED